LGDFACGTIISRYLFTIAPAGAFFKAFAITGLHLLRTAGINPAGNLMVLFKAEKKP